MNRQKAQEHDITHEKKYTLAKSTLIINFKIILKCKLNVMLSNNELHVTFN